MSLRRCDAGDGVEGGAGPRRPRARTRRIRARAYKHVTYDTSNDTRTMAGGGGGRGVSKYEVPCDTRSRLDTGMDRVIDTSSCGYRDTHMNTHNVLTHIAWPRPWYGGWGDWFGGVGVGWGDDAGRVRGSTVLGRRRWRRGVGHRVCGGWSVWAGRCGWRGRVRGASRELVQLEQERIQCRGEWMRTKSWRSVLVPDVLPLRGWSHGDCTRRRGAKGVPINNIS